MADKKVSDLPSLNGADVDAADLLYIVDSSAGAAGSKKITVGQYQLAPVSGGTANTVVYLNGSKVESSSSALTFDGTNFATTGTSSAAKLIPTGGTAAGNGMYLPAANTLAWSNNGAETMRLDSSGNLGLGVTPSAWGSGWKSYTNQLYGEYYSTNGGYVGLASNAYYNGANWIYKNTTRALRFESDIPNGAHVWYTAPSGTAGDPITFTQAMTLDASGNLAIGGTAVQAKVNIQQSLSGTYGSAGIWLTDNSTTSMLFNNVSNGVSAIWASGALTFGTGSNNNTERARITSGGDFLAGKTVTTFSTDGVSLSNVGSNFSYTSGTVVAVNRNGTDGNAVEFYKAGVQVGTISVTGSATAYNTSSDYRLKDNPQPLTGSGAFIDALQPKTWNWKVDGSKGVGFIAHEAQAVSPSSVTGTKDAVDEDGKPVMQAMEYGSAEFIANIIAELQSLRARVAALEAK